MYELLLLSFLSVFNIHPEATCKLNPQRNFGEQTPIVLRNGRYLEPTEHSGDINLPHGEVLILSCEGAGHIIHPNMKHKVITAAIACEGADYFQNKDWLEGDSRFQYFMCVDPPRYSSRRTGRSCFEGHAVFEVGYTVNRSFYPTYESCFNESGLRVIYSKYTQKPYNTHYRPSSAQPFFVDDGVYRFVSPFVDTLFSRDGLHDLVSYYVTNAQTLTRGHLAARMDFVFPYAQRTTFHYVNCAPQWSDFKRGNWHTLEKDLRNHIHSGGFNTIIYTGTHGVTEMETRNGRKVEVYLHTDSNNKPLIPVPLYFYKVVYDIHSQLGTAFVGINDPFISAAEARELFFCNDQCRGKKQFKWLTWQPDIADDGYSFCCTIPEFINTIDHLPPMEVKGLLT